MKKEYITQSDSNLSLGKSPPENGIPNQVINYCMKKSESN